MYAEIEGNPKIGQHWGTAPLQWGVPDTIEKCPLHMCSAARSNSSRVIK